MKGTVLLALFALAPCFVFSQTINRTDGQGKKQGRWEAYFDDEKTALRYKGIFLNDEPEGELLYYYYEPKNTVRVKMNCKGNVCGVEYYFPSGRLSAKGEMLSKKREGKWGFFYENGNKLGEENYKGGLKQGLSINYRENGKTADEINYVDDIPNGPARYYDSEGLLVFSGEFSGGKRTGLWKVYDKGEFYKEIDYMKVTEPLQETEEGGEERQ